MLLWCVFLLSIGAQVLSAPQNGIGNIPESPPDSTLNIPDSPLNIPDSSKLKEIVKPTTPAPTEKKKVDPLVIVANLPSSPINVSDSAKPCSSCGKGPLLACPKDDGECGSGEACCYDTCRARQVCRPKSEIVGYKEPNKRFQKRETDEKGDSEKLAKSTSDRQNVEVPAPLDESLSAPQNVDVPDPLDESLSARQNINVPAPLGEEYGTFDASQSVFSPSFSEPESLVNNQESFSVFASSGGDREGEVFPPSGANLYNQFQQDPFTQFNDFEEEIPFVFNQAPQQLIPVQQPVIIPDQYIPGNEDQNDDEGGFFETLFG